MLTLEQNIRAVLETNFSETKDDIIDNALKIILELVDTEMHKTYETEKSFCEFKGSLCETCEMQTNCQWK